MFNDLTLAAGENWLGDGQGQRPWGQKHDKGNKVQIKGEVPEIHEAYRTAR